MNGEMIVVPWPRTDGREWGTICPEHPQRGEQRPTDWVRESAEALAEASVCSHPSHKGTRLETRAVPAYMGQLVEIKTLRRVGRARIAYFGDHQNAGLVEIGFLDGSTQLVPFDWAKVAWPVDDMYQGIPRYPDEPDAHLTHTCAPGINWGCDVPDCDGDNGD